MKKLVYIFTIAASLIGCSDFLDTENLVKKDTANFPVSVTDAEQMITGIYSNLNDALRVAGGSYYFISELVADDRLGSGGENDKQWHAIDYMMTYSTLNDELNTFWVSRYQGIFRSNIALETLDNVTDATEEQLNNFKGEAYFLRAFFYYEMASLFENVPLVLVTEPENKPQATPDETFGQIASDLKNAIELLPNQAYTATSSGHTTKWAAEALMARVFLFYTDFYGKTEIALPGEEGGSVTKSQVVSWLEDCINNSGHDLVGDYRNLWPYTNRYTVEDYDYTKGQGLKWAEDDGAVNPEVLFAIKFSSNAKWGEVDGITNARRSFSNQCNLYFGLRGNQPYENTFPYGRGWGAGSVNPSFFTEWEATEPTDMRRDASILDLRTFPNYAKGQWEHIQETDYWQKKYSPVSAIKEDGSYAETYSVLMYNTNTSENFQLANTQDIVLIRLADVYLMHSELTETGTYMNLVRNRAGLPGISYSLENIQNERRWELAFEGIRWNDIRRWDIAGDELAKQAGVKTYFRGIEYPNKEFGGGYKARYEATKGFFQIPTEQISLAAGVLVQNKGWESGDINYEGWN